MTILRIYIFDKKHKFCYWLLEAIGSSLEGIQRMFRQLKEGCHLMLLLVSGSHLKPSVRDTWPFYKKAVERGCLFF
jgi:hypothetical protein